MYGHPIQSQARRVAAKEEDPVAAEEEDPVAAKEGQIQDPVATTEEEGQ